MALACLRRASIARWDLATAAVVLLLALLALETGASSPVPVKYRFRYLTYDEINAGLRALARQYPDVLAVESAHERFGVPTSGLCRQSARAKKASEPCEVLIATVGRRPIEKDRPQMTVFGSIHGDERLGALIAFYLVKMLVDLHNSDAWLARLVATRALTVVPLPNPAGFDRQMRLEDADGQLVDPNTDFPLDAESPEHCMRSAAARVINELFLDNLFRVAIFFHGKREFIGFSWGDERHCQRATAHIQLAQQNAPPAADAELAAHDDENSVPLSDINDMFDDMNNNHNNTGSSSRGSSRGSSNAAAHNARRLLGAVDKSALRSAPQGLGNGEEDDDDDEQDDVECADGWKSPDHAAFSELAGAMSLFAAPFKKSSYRTGALNELFSPARGGVADWSYAASFEPKRTRTCHPDTYGGYAPDKTRYTNASNRCLTFVVETGRTAQPPEKDLGSSAGLYSRRYKLGNGHVPRNIRLALLALDMLEPYVFFAFGKPGRQPELSGGGLLQLRWSVGGALSVASTYLTIEVLGERTFDTITTPPANGGSMWARSLVPRSSTPASSSSSLSASSAAAGSYIFTDEFSPAVSYYEDNDVAKSPALTSFFGRFASSSSSARSTSAGRRWVYSETLSLYKLLPREVAQRGATLRIRAAAEVDPKWAGGDNEKQPRAESHLARARTDAAWFATNGERAVRGRRVFFSEPLTVRLPSERALRSARTSDMWETLLIALIIFAAPPLLFLAYLLRTGSSATAANTGGRVSALAHTFQPYSTGAAVSAMRARLRKAFRSLSSRDLAGDFTRFRNTSRQTPAPTATSTAAASPKVSSSDRTTATAMQEQYRPS